MASTSPVPGRTAVYMPANLSPIGTVLRTAWSPAFCILGASVVLMVSPPRLSSAGSTFSTLVT
jgi:hypothetical protein